MRISASTDRQYIDFNRVFLCKTGTYVAGTDRGRCSRRRAPTRCSPPVRRARPGWPHAHRDYFVFTTVSARICSTRFIGAIGGRFIETIHVGMVYPGTLFHMRQRGIPMHSYENRTQIRALIHGRSVPCGAVARAHRALKRERC